MNRALVHIGAAVRIGVALTAVVPVCLAQSIPDAINPLGTGVEGLHLYEVSIFSGYSTSAYPVGQLQVPAGFGALSADVNYGVSAAAGWQHHRDQSNFSVHYSGAYTGMVHYSGANGYSQWLTLNADRKIARKLTVNVSATGEDSTFIQYLNQPSAAAVTTDVASNFNDFAAAFGLGNFSSASAASSILGAPVVQAPLRALLLGNKVLSYSGSANLNYAYSPHLGFHASTFGSGGESRGNAQDGVPATNYVLPRSFGVEAGIAWNYTPSPRSDFGFNLDANRLQNHFQDAYTSTATATAGRKMGAHWFAKVYGGITETQVTKQLSGMPKTLQEVGGGSLGIKTYTQSFVASYDRSASDTYGSFVGTYSTETGTWNWRRPGSRLALSAGYGEQQVRNTGFESFSGWQASAGFSELLAGTTSLSGQYVFFKTTGSYLGNTTGFSVHSVRLSVNWSAQAMRR